MNTKYEIWEKEKENIYIWKIVQEQNNFCSNNISKILGISGIIIRVLNADTSYY